ncbi:MAG: hypothetical protein RSN88_11585, partial [Gordonibacter sp.]|uniref:hypothetical protein n=1 Tax=Gordonibacter sp. TaxID=1968902 RepID=UPI002FCB8311
EPSTTEVVTKLQGHGSIEQPRINTKPCFRNKRKQGFVFMDEWFGDKRRPTTSSALRTRQIR